MSPVAGPVLAAAGLLAVSGVLKVRRPGATVGALRSAGLPSARGWVVALGAVEVAVGGWAVLAGGPSACAAVAALYLAFAGFAFRLQAAGRAGSCGCFGQASTVASPLHVAINVAVASVVALGAWWPPEGLPAAVVDQPVAVGALVVLGGLGAWATLLALTGLADLDAARRPAEALG